MTSREWLPQQAAFESVRRGYSPEQVNEYLDRLEYDLRILTADRDSANHQLAELTSQFQAIQSDAEELRNQLDRTATAPASMAGLSERMQRMIRLAEEEASEIRARAQADSADQQADLEKRIADQIEQRRVFDAERERARGQLAQQVKDLTTEAIAESDRLRSEASHDAADIVAAAQAESERLVTQAREHYAQVTAKAQQVSADAAAERSRRDAEAHARRKEVEDDFGIAITARRTQAHQYVAEQEHESRLQAQELINSATAEAERLVAEATAEAQRRVAYAAAESHRRVTEADQAVDRLVEMRNHVLAQLAGLAPIIAQVQDAAQDANELLTANPEEAVKPTGADFDPEVAKLDFEPSSNEDDQDQLLSPSLTSANISGASSK